MIWPERAIPHWACNFERRSVSEPSYSFGMNLFCLLFSLSIILYRSALIKCRTKNKYSAYFPSSYFFRQYCKTLLKDFVLPRWTSLRKYWTTSSILIFFIWCCVIHSSDPAEIHKYERADFKKWKVSVLVFQSLWPREEISLPISSWFIIAIISVNFWSTGTNLSYLLIGD